MKLLTRQQTEDSKQRETTFSILRTRELQEAEAQARKSYAKAEADFKEALARHSEEWAVKLQAHAEQTDKMKREIDVLEAKKMNALIPAGVINEITEGRLDDAVKYVEELREREENLEQTRELLEDNLDRVGELEQKTLLREKKVSLREQGVDRQAENIKLQSESLTKQITDFALKKQQEEKMIEERKTILALKERTLLAKEETQKRTDKALLEKEVRLADERQTLDRAWKELKAKYPPKT